MHCTVKMTEDLYWVGASDRRLALFESVYPIPRGVSYNAYVLLDEKTVLLDTVDQSVAGQFFENLTHTLAVGFYTGTNNTRMVTSGPVGGVESGNVYLTTKDHAWEVNFDSQYKIYENLTLAAEMGFVRLDLDKDLWKGVGYEAKENNFKGTFSIGYKF